MQKAIRLGLAVDESLTTSQIGEYINYRTAAYWLADDKGAGTVDLSQEASAKGAAAKAAKANQAASRPRAVSRALRGELLHEQCGGDAARCRRGGDWQRRQRREPTAPRGERPKRGASLRRGHAPQPVDGRAVTRLSTRRARQSRVCGCAAQWHPVTRAAGATPSPSPNP